MRRLCHAGPAPADRWEAPATVGADIAQELAETGELPRMLARLGAGYRDEAEERVVDVISGARA